VVLFIKTAVSAVLRRISFKLRCVIASAITVAGIVCLAVIEGRSPGEPNAAGLLLLVAGILCWAGLAAGGFGAHGGGGPGGGGGGCGGDGGGGDGGGGDGGGGGGGCGGGGE